MSSDGTMARSARCSRMRSLVARIGSHGPSLDFRGDCWLALDGPRRGEKDQNPSVIAATFKAASKVAQQKSPPTADAASAIHLRHEIPLADLPHLWLKHLHDPLAP